VSIHRPVPPAGLVQVQVGRRALSTVLDVTTGVVGFFGASSMERLPTERAIAAQAADFKNLKL